MSQSDPAEATAAPDTNHGKSEHVPNQTPSASSANPSSKKETAAPLTLPKPLKELAAAVPSLVTSSGHPEIWGVTLSSDPDTHVPTQVVLQKYLNANDGDLQKAKAQLQATLEWRAKMKPLELVKQKFNQSKFTGLGYVTVYAGADEKEIFTWNIYGGVKSIDETFGDLEEFIRWRVALMELALSDLNLPSATTPITETNDPYKITQIHDYKSISFLRQTPSVKAASTETIQIFAQNYPELLKEKFFLNVPAIMGFVFALIKPFVAEKTRKKFHPMSNGAGLAAEFNGSKIAGLGDKLPKEYGGKGADLKAAGRGLTME